jgi:hypothetical protein
MSESPLHLCLSWRATKTSSVSEVGTFRLDLHALLAGGYIREDPAGSYGADVRVRVFHDADGHFYIQTNQDGPRTLML